MTHRTSSGADTGSGTRPVESVSISINMTEGWQGSSSPGISIIYLRLNNTSASQVCENLSRYCGTSEGRVVYTLVTFTPSMVVYGSGSCRRFNRVRSFVGT